MIIDKNKMIENPGRKFTFFYEDVEIPVYMRVISKASLLAIEEKHSKTAYVKGQPVKKVDDKAVEEDRADYCVVGWEGFKNPDGSVLEVTRENKLWLIENFPAFSSFFNRTLVGLLTGETAMLEKEEKN